MYNTRKAPSYQRKKTKHFIFTIVQAKIPYHTELSGRTLLSYSLVSLISACLLSKSEPLMIQKASALIVMEHLRCNYANIRLPQAKAQT